MNKNQKPKLKAIVLAAGVGSRLNETTNHIPKGMIRVNGKYIFEIILENLSQAGIKEVIFVLGYQRKMFMPLIQTASRHLGIKVTFVINTRYRETNTMYSFWLARRHLDSAFIYLHGDLIFGKKMLKKIIKAHSSNAVLVDTKFPMDWDDAMKIISHRDEIKYMSKSITIHEMDGIAIGVYKFSKRGAKNLISIVNRLVRRKVKNVWISEAINIMAKTTKIKCEKNPGFAWVDVDNLADLDMANIIYGKIERE
jgi:choline kinase